MTHALTYLFLVFAIVTTLVGLFVGIGMLWYHVPWLPALVLVATIVWLYVRSRREYRRRSAK